MKFTISPDDAGERLDRYLAKHCTDLSRSQIKVLIEAGDILSDSKATKASQVLKGGEEIAVRVPPTQSMAALPENLPLNILYEDSDLIVLNKTAEMVVHLGAGVKDGTVVNALLHHCKDLSGIGGVARPGIVHRLDKGTSGILVVAKNDQSHQSLSAQFQNRQVEKTYLAFVWGRPRDLTGKIDIPIGRSARDRKKISTQGQRLREAVTRYRLVKSWEVMSLLELKPETGRTHQLRVHLAELGHPIVGDPTYGKTGTKRMKVSPQLLERLHGLSFQLLHAHKLTFTHPTSGKTLTFEAPMRGEMEEFRKILEENADAAL